MLMPKCELCDEMVTQVFTCKECDSKFCKDCGTPSQKLCDYCIEEPDEDWEDDDWEELGEEPDEDWEESDLAE